MFPVLIQYALPHWKKPNVPNAERRFAQVWKKNATSKTQSPARDAASAVETPTTTVPLASEPKLAHARTLQVKH